jgi:tRNA uridine 5-carboxymethylaminomethyl modification enzyme
LQLLRPEEAAGARARLRKEEEIRTTAEGTVTDPSKVNKLLLQLGSAQITEPVKMADLARRPEVPLRTVLGFAGVETDESAEWAEIEFKYAGYVARERTVADRVAKMDELKIPEMLDYRALNSLSYEAREKLESVRPISIGQASRIPGLTPNDLHGVVVEVLKARNDRAPVSRETPE